MSEPNELKPCPFCGGPSEAVVDSDDELTIGCTDIKCAGHDVIYCWNNTPESYEAWNQRAETAQLKARIEELKEEEEASIQLIDRQGDLLSRTAIALKGPEPELTRWSHHDVPELAAQLKADLDKARAERDVEKREREAVHWCWDKAMAVMGYPHPQKMNPGIIGAAEQLVAERDTLQAENEMLKEGLEWKESADRHQLLVLDLRKRLQNAEIEIERLRAEKTDAELNAIRSRENAEFYRKHAYGELKGNDYY